MTGATGSVGGQVVAQLREPVRSFSRATGGDLTNVDSVRAALDGVDKVFLVWPFFHTDGLEKVLDAIAEQAKRIVYLSSAGAPDWAGAAETLIEQTGLEWTFLRPTGFAANALQWAAEIKSDGVVRTPYGDLARPHIHEYDMAAVGVRALLTDDHVGAKLTLSGPELVTQYEQVRIIGEVIGRDLRLDEQSPEQARAAMLAGGWPTAMVDQVLAGWAAMAADPEPVVSTVEDVTGVRAKTFRDWADDHASAFTSQGG
nr:zinc-binding oxidoreductase [Kibdelosporangium sp. MJ126-NF4]CTQ92785.1 zinc-binding oxidoreductase [Kibdelosporangium sp. MJ126-NF4]